MRTSEPEASSSQRSSSRVAIRSSRVTRWGSRQTTASLWSRAGRASSRSPAIGPTAVSTPALAWAGSSTPRWAAGPPSTNGLALALQADGKVVVAGDSDAPNPLLPTSPGPLQRQRQPRHDVRAGGIVLTDASGSGAGDGAAAVTIEADARSVAAGSGVAGFALRALQRQRQPRHDLWGRRHRGDDRLQAGGDERLREGRRDPGRRQDRGGWVLEHCRSAKSHGVRAGPLQRRRRARRELRHRWPRGHRHHRRCGRRGERRHSAGRRQDHRGGIVPVRARSRLRPGPLQRRRQPRRALRGRGHRAHRLRGDRVLGYTLAIQQDGRILAVGPRTRPGPTTSPSPATASTGLRTRASGPPARCSPISAEPTSARVSRSSRAAVSSQRGPSSSAPPAALPGSLQP